MIGIEKHSVGTPLLFLPRNVQSDATKLAGFESLLETYCAHEKQYIILDASLRTASNPDPLTIIKGDYNHQATHGAIDRENAAMVDSILASFLEIGTKRAGGNSQNEGQLELFLNSLLNITSLITDNLDDLAHNYYLFNFGEPEIILKMNVLGISKDDAAKTMEIQFHDHVVIGDPTVDPVGKGFYSFRAAGAL
jgi:hypothetical protein